MSYSDTRFVGSIPAIYDSILGPLLFESYAGDLAARVASGRPSRVLEIAAGTGIVTRALSRALPESTIVATDLNPAMLAVASEKLTSPRVTFQQADAQALAFGNAEFDAVVSQFGVMFFPDKGAALKHARRVLRSGGRMLFSVWDRIEANPVSEILGEQIVAAFPDDPPGFLARGPFSWHDADSIRQHVKAAGFANVTVETVKMATTVTSADSIASGFCKGSPVLNEINARAPERIDEIIAALSTAITKRFGTAPFANEMSALVVTAAT